ISNLAFISNSKILYVGIAISGYSGNGELYTSTDGISFQKNSKINNEVTAITISSNGTIYIGTYKSYSKG
ncbi:two-component regulator propeller domain-containing protein, partial [Borreliella garinii]